MLADAYCRLLCGGTFYVGNEQRPVGIFDTRKFGAGWPEEGYGDSGWSGNLDDDGDGECDGVFVGE